MQTAVADSSALISLGVVTEFDSDPLSLFFASYDVVLPTEVVEELQETASYADKHGQAAATVLDRHDAFTTRRVELDSTFPLDDGENAAVTLANRSDASLCLCDEFNQLGLVHASLANTRLVMTPTLLSVFVRTDKMSAGNALQFIDAISDARSWSKNSYVQRARSLVEKFE